MNNQWKPHLVPVDGHQIATLYRPAERSSPATQPLGPLLVLIHGITASVNLWPEVIEAVPQFRQFDCLSISLPGHWPSTTPAEFSAADVSTEFFVRTLSAAINHHSIDRPVNLVGWSTGGFSALALAADPHFGRRVSAVVSLSGFARGVWHGWLGIWQHLAAWRVHHLSYHAVLKALQSSEFLHVAIASSFMGQPRNRQLRCALAASSMHRELQQHHGTALRKLMGGIRFCDLTSQLSAISCPVSIVNGDRDPVILPSEASHLHACIPNSTLSLLSNVGHMVFTEAPELVLAHVLQSIRK